MMRELKEEVVMNNYPSPKIIGFLNLNYEVHAVHFGLVAIGETEEDVKPAEDMSHGKFYSIEEINSLFSNPENDVEEWTRISWPFVKNNLLNILMRVPAEDRLAPVTLAMLQMPEYGGVSLEGVALIIDL